MHFMTEANSSICLGECLSGIGSVEERVEELEGGCVVLDAKCV